MKKMILVFLLLPLILQAKDIAIIGGGTAGTMAFTFLSETKHNVDLFEARPIIGGNARSPKVFNPVTQKHVHVDMGPLVFATGPWDLYIDMLEYYGITKREFHKFRGSIAVWKQGENEHPTFVTPKGNINYLKYLYKDKALKKVLEVALILQKSYKDFKKGTLSPNTSILEWMNSKGVDQETAREILFPIFTSFHTADFKEADKFAILPIMYTTTFRSPLTLKKLLASKPGMGTWVQRIGTRVDAESLRGKIHRNTKVTYMDQRKDGKWVLGFNGSKATKVYDEVIVATHPHHALEFLKTNKYPAIKRILSGLKYHPSRGVLHNDKRYILEKHSRFLNIIKRDDYSLITTMDLGEIDKNMKGLYLTSGLKEHEVQDIRNNAKIYAEERFYHPLYKTDFYSLTTELRKKTKSVSGLHFAGGWTLVGEETQETATLSGYLSAREAVDAPEQLDQIWTKRLKKLNDYLKELL